MNRKIILGSIITYLIGLSASFLFDIRLPHSAKADTSLYINNLKNLHQSEICLMILKNNLFVIGVNIIGCLSFGIISFANTLLNGFTLGYLLKVIITNYSIEFAVRFILPHSIELIAIILSCYVGYKLGIEVYKFISTKDYSVKIDKWVLLSVLSSILIVFLASIIEAYVTIP